METKPMCSNVQIIYNFSEWLKSELDSRQLTVVRLAHISGVHQNTIRNYLAGRCEPTLFNVQCVVGALGYDVGVIPHGHK
jgi:hypothetical protein